MFLEIILVERIKAQLTLRNLEVNRMTVTYNNGIMKHTISVCFVVYNFHGCHGHLMYIIHHNFQWILSTLKPY